MLYPKRYPSREVAEDLRQCTSITCRYLCLQDIKVGAGTCAAVLLTTAHLQISKSCCTLAATGSEDLQHCGRSKNHHLLYLQDIKVGAGTCAAVLPTTARLSDPQGMLHPGCYCSLVDLISTTALAAADKRPAVSVTISVDFYAGLPIGEELEIESHVVKTGKSLTFAEVNFRYNKLLLRLPYIAY